MQNPYKMSLLETNRILHKEMLKRARRVANLAAEKEALRETLALLERELKGMTERANLMAKALQRERKEHKEIVAALHQQTLDLEMALQKRQEQVLEMYKVIREVSQALDKMRQ
jgi:predicted  nucleic acid-binding Zn-ribbon protein